MEQDIYRIIRFWPDDKDKTKIWQCTIDYVLANHEETIANMVYIMKKEAKRRNKKVDYGYEKVVPKDSLIEGTDSSLVDDMDYGFAFDILELADKDKEDEVKLHEGAELYQQFQWHQSPL